MACFYWAWSWSSLFKVRKVFFCLSLLLINSLVVFYGLFLPLTRHSIFTHWIQIQCSRFACSGSTYADRWDHLFPAPALSLYASNSTAPVPPPTLLPKTDTGITSPRSPSSGSPSPPPSLTGPDLHRSRSLTRLGEGGADWTLVTEAITSC
jgi:hypothetical protein